MPERVFISGAAGFLGRRLCTELSQNGFLVDGLARRPSDVDGCNIVVGDVENYGSYGEQAGKADLIIHLAAPTLGAEIHARPLDAMRINVVGTINLLTAFAAGPGRHFLLVSTGKVYGPPLSLPISEEHVLNPDTALGRSKLECEHLLQFFAQHTPGKRYSAIRLFNAYGPRQRAGMLIPWIMSQAAQPGNEVEIVLGNTSPKRDFILIDDVIAAFRAIIESNRFEAGRADVYNVGSGESHSPEEIVQNLAQISGKSLKLRNDQARMRRGEPPEERASIERMRALGWAPKASLYSGLAKTWLAFNNNDETRD